MAVALPRIGSTQANVSFQSTTLRLAAELRATRSEAVWSNVEKTLSIDVGENAYWSDVHSTRQRIPPEIHLEFSGAAFDASDMTTKRVRFMPDGNAGAGRIRLMGEQRSAVLTIDWLTGSTNVAWVK